MSKKKKEKTSKDRGLYSVTFTDQRTTLPDGSENPDYKREVERVLSLPLPAPISRRDEHKASAQHSRQSWLVARAREVLKTDLGSENSDDDRLFSRVTVGDRLL